MAPPCRSMPDRASLPERLQQVDDRTMGRWIRRGIYRRSRQGGGMEKRCSACRHYFPADTEFFYANRGLKDGLYDWCKACYCAWRWPNGRRAKAAPGAAAAPAAAKPIPPTPKRQEPRPIPKQTASESQQDDIDVGDLSPLDETIVAAVRADPGITAPDIYDACSDYADTVETARAVARLVRLGHLEVRELEGARTYHPATPPEPESIEPIEPPPARRVRVGAQLRGCAVGGRAKPEPSPKRRSA